MKIEDPIRGTRVINIKLTLSEQNYFGAKAKMNLPLLRDLTDDTNNGSGTRRPIVQLLFSDHRKVKDRKNNPRAIFSFIRLVRILFFLYGF